MLPRWHGCPLAALLSLAIVSASAQEPQFTLKKHGPQISVNVREVVVDITVYNGNGYTSRGEPVRGLHREDFEVFENGRPQAVRSFEEHGALSPTETRGLTLQATESSAALSVILVDQSSLGFESQPWALQQLETFVHAAPPGNPIAIFALTPGLRVVQPFTTDRGKLIAALRNIHPLPSPLLQTDDESTLSTYAADSLRAAASDFGSPSAAAMADQLDRVRGGILSTLAEQRTSSTLAAFQTIAHYLHGLPGRKNLIWLGSSFTDRPFGLDTEPDPQFKRTADLLQLARVAVFPIDASGLIVAGNGAAVPLPGITGAESATLALNNARSEGALGRNASHGTMDDIAERTGGEAYYNTNGLAWAMDRVVAQSNAYYTLVYNSSDIDRAADYSKIQVRLKGHHLDWRLSYRRGYFVNDSVQLRRNAVEPVALEPFMDPGMPAISQLHLGLATALAPGPDRPGEPLAGGNRKLAGPVHRYTFSMGVPICDVALSRNKDGHTEGNLVFDLVAYNDRGVLVNWLSRRLTPSLDAEQLRHMQQTGLALEETLDLPPGHYLVRGGFYDLNTARVGTRDTLLTVDP